MYFPVFILALVYLPPLPVGALEKSKMGRTIFRFSYSPDFYLVCHITLYDTDCSHYNTVGTPT